LQGQDITLYSAASKPTLERTQLPIQWVPRAFSLDKWPECGTDIYFSIYLILQAALCSGLHSASNRNEYQKQKNNVSGE
jgi:hypothetical protein